MATNTIIPPLPSGFQLEGSSSGSTPAMPSTPTMPALPPGFQIEGNSPVLNQNKTDPFSNLPQLNVHNPSLLEKVRNYFSDQSPVGSVGYNIARTTEQVPEVVNKISEIPSSIQNMSPGVTRGVLSNLTAPNIVTGVTGVPVIEGLSKAGPFGKALAASILGGFGIQGAQQGIESGKQAVSEPAGGQRREDIANAVLGFGQVLPLLAERGLMDVPRSGVSAENVKGLNSIDTRGDQPIPMGGQGRDQQNVTQDSGRMLMQPGQVGLADLMKAAEDKQKLYSPSRQIPERAQSVIDQTKDQAQQKLVAAQNQPSGQGFVAGNRGVASVSDATGVSDLTRPKALIGNEPVISPIEQRVAALEEQLNNTRAQQPAFRVGEDASKTLHPEQANAMVPNKTVVKSDYDRFQELTSQASESIKQGVFPPEEVQREIEQIKNRNGGMVPKPVEAKMDGQGQTELHSGIGLPKQIQEPLDNAVDKVTSKISDFIKSRPIKDTLTYMKDATSNLASKNANESASRISGMLERVTKEKDSKNSIDRQALSFVVEAEQDPKKLEAFRDQLTKAPVGKDRAESLYAVNYALKNLDKLKPVAEEYSKLIENQAKLEESSGRSIERRKGYVMHLAEDTGDSSSFIHKREYDTLADRIAAGVPKGSLDAVELLRSRVARGQQIYVQSKVFVDNVKKLKSPEGQPIVGEYEKVSRGEGKEPDVRPPKGYREIQMGYHKVPVLDSYADTLQALTSPSWFMQHALGRGTLEARGVGKHIVLGLDTFHLGRLGTYGVASKIGTGNIPKLNYTKGVTILDNSMEELKAKAAAGQIDKDSLPDMLEAKRRLDLGIKTGFNIGRNIDAFNQHWTAKVPVTGKFQNWLFNTFQRGVMSDVYTTAWDSYKKQMPNATDAGVARKLSKDLNEVFGTIGRQGLVKSRTGQDIMSLLFLAPQWTEGRIRSDIGAITGSIKAAGQAVTGKKPELNMQSRVVGSTILMYLLANQAINLATTGHSTFENEKGHELEAFIPDKISGSKGYWLNPTANAEEIMYTMEQSLKREGGDVWQAWLDFVGGRLSTVTQPLAVGVTGRQYGITGPYVNETNGKKPGYGGPSGEAKLEAMLKDVVPVPIGGGLVSSALTGKVDANTEKRILTSVGLKVTSDSAGSPAPGKKKKQRYTITR